MVDDVGVASLVDFRVVAWADVAHKLVGSPYVIAFNMVHA